MLHFQYYQKLERQLLETETPIPVYFAYESEDLVELYEKIAASITSDAASSAAKGIHLTSISISHFYDYCSPAFDFCTSSILNS